MPCSSTSPAEASSPRRASGCTPAICSSAAAPRRRSDRRQATIAGEEYRWSTVGLYRIEAARVAEVWLLPLDPEHFDRIWTHPNEQEEP